MAARAMGFRPATFVLGGLVRKGKVCERGVVSP
jgi:hypothetical protein